MRSAPCASAVAIVVCAKVIGGIIFFTYFCTALTRSRFSGGSKSEMPTTTTVLIDVFGRTSATLVANRSMTISPTAPLSVNWCTISAVV